MLGPEHRRVGVPTEGGLQLSPDQGCLQAQLTRVSGSDQEMKGEGKQAGPLGDLVWQWEISYTD